MDTADTFYREFEQHARAFIDAILDPSTVGASGILHLRQRLLALYVAATMLPEVGDEQMRDIKDVESRFEDWEALCKSLARRLPVDVYRLIFNPLDNEEAITNTLSCDLSEIWMDLDEAIRLKEQNGSEFQTEIWWNWRFDFTSHWGRHAMNALRVMHELIEHEHLSLVL